MLFLYRFRGQILIDFVFKMPLVILHLLLRYHRLFFRVSECVKEMLFKVLVTFSLCVSQPSSEAGCANASITEGAELAGIWLGPVFGPLCRAQLCKQTYFCGVCDWNPALNSLKYLRTKKSRTAGDAHSALMGCWGWEQWFKLSLVELSTIRQKL